ncbi:MAG: hypothetical protein WC552_01310 [Candidatus Omnitrophota bacterium]
MSKLTQAIKGCMKDLTFADPGDIRALFNFPEDFIGFKGHFPGRPILPGVCKVQAVICLLEAATKKKPRIKELISAKFLAPVTCNEEIVFNVSRSAQGGDDTLFKAVISDAKKKIASIELRVTFCDAKELL